VTAISLLQIGNFLTSHWGIVLVIGAVFFLLQIVLCVRFYFRMSRHEQRLKRLYGDLQAGGDGRLDIDAHAVGFPWLSWVQRVFPAGTTTPGNYTRDDVLQELDTRIASSPDYLFLQRMGVMAPLLGVILTVLGFAWLEAPQGTEESLEQFDLDSILFAVTPLVAGVGTGAVLAFINQGLLYAAGMKTEAVRMAARTWFDAVIWCSVGLDTQAATVKAVAGIEKMAHTISDSADKQMESTRWLADSTLAIQEAATEFCTMVQDFGGKTRELPETMDGMREAMAESVETIQSLAPVAERVIAGLDVSVMAFRTSVETQTREATSLQKNLEQLARAVEQIEQAGNLLARGTESIEHVLQRQAGVQREIEPAHEAMKTAIDRIAVAGTNLQRTIDDHVAPSQLTMGRAVDSFARSADRLSSFVDEGLAPVTQRLTTLDKTLSRLEGTVNAMQGFADAGSEIQKLSQSLAQAATVAQAISELPEQIRQVLEQTVAAHRNEMDNTQAGWLGRLRGRSRS
jgi:ABC-type transporter Mla subunit MlaD